MKATFIKYIMAVAATLSLCSCVEEQFEKAMPDKEDCVGVFFLEEQANIKTHTLEKGVDKTSLDFIVRRTNTDEEVTVPFTTEVYCIETEPLTDTSTVEKKKVIEDLFTFGTIKFAKGQSETTVNVRFDRITTGITYTCTMNIVDPEYASIYAANTSSVTFSVQMYEWTRLPQKAIYRDGFFSDMFTWKGRFLETEVDIYQRKDKKGYYRLHNVYDAKYFARLVEGDEAYNEDPEAMEQQYSAYVEKDHYLLLDATNPEKVYFPAQKTGFTDPSLGAIIIASDVAEVFGASSNLLYGKVVDNVITFPKNGLNFGMGEYYYFSNTSGKFRIVLPGGKAEDYAFDIKVSEVTPEGKVPVKFELTKDISYVKYSVFKGKISDIGLSSKVDEVKNADASKTAVLKKEDADQTQNLELDDTFATGTYTIVACSYDAAGNYKEFSYAYIGYVKADEYEDNKPQIKIGLHTDDRFESDKKDENYNSTNSFQYWVRGKGITHLQLSYYPTKHFKAYEELIKKDMAAAASLPSDYLNVINSDGLSGIIGNNLKAATDYTLIVYAGNDYLKEFFTASVSTLGTANPVEMTYYYTDLAPENQDIDRFTSCDWIPVSVDIFDTEASGRSIRGRKNSKGVFVADTVKFRREGEKMIASGLYPSLPSNPEITFDIKDNKLVTTENRLNQVYIKDTTNIVPTLQLEYLFRPKPVGVGSDGYLYDSYEDDDDVKHYDWMTAGFVSEDVIAFTDNNTEYMFWALAMGGYRDIRGEDVYYQVIGDGHGDLILVKAGSALLDGLLGKESVAMKDNQTLNSLTEQNKIKMPDMHSVITDDHKRFDISHDMVGFKVEKQ